MAEAWRGIRLGEPIPLVDGEPAAFVASGHDGVVSWWRLESGIEIRLHRRHDSEGRQRLRVEAIGASAPLLSLGLRYERVEGVRRYLRNGYQSWDGSFFVAPGTPAGSGPPGKAPTLGFALTALLPEGQAGALVIGFERHDRFQSRFRFGGTAAALRLDIETLLDHAGSATEELVIFAADAVEPGLRDWSRMVADAGPLAPRIPERRITGWCSWYNLYAAITEANLLEHLAGARTFRDAHAAPLDIFLIDDGFTPEMGDWLDAKPQFPRGMAPLVRDIAAAGFTPGLWIAPFMVGNRSRLFADHPDWVVRDRDTGGPLVQMRFYGEFRWHKRSEEYYILDITHPAAEAYIRQVFRTWARDWGVGYFKTDFMLFGAEHGPDRAAWHRPGQSRIAIWRQMATLIRDEIGDALWLGCGCPLWASVGLVDAVRIGRDIGVAWNGEYSAESLLRDQLTRNHGSGILWQADPDCILLRDRFHDLSDDEVRSLALFAGFAGGVLMTSDTLDALSPARAQLFARLLAQPVAGCDFPDLGLEAPVVRQIVRQTDGGRFESRFNMGPSTIDGLASHATDVGEDGGPW